MHFARMLIAVAGTVILAANAPHASASAPVSGPGALCVGGAGCLLTIQAAVDAAPVGATIRITAGTFAGGVTIGKSLRLVGSGAGRTVIRGGGPVLTISTRASGPPAVSISGVTVTGGTARGDGVEAWGGGIFISAADDGTVGATVILKDVAVKGNLAVPTATSPSPSGVKCPAGDCPYAATRGGGIANFGTLTLDRSAVSDNGAVGYASDANGGGIFSALGALILTSSSVDGNRAVPDSIGRFAEGGGIFVDSGALTISYSRISNNRAELVTRWPIRPQGVLLDMNAHAGGIHVGDGSEVLIERTSIKGNAVRADDPDGEVVGFDSAILIGDSHLVMRRGHRQQGDSSDGDLRGRRAERNGGGSGRPGRDQRFVHHRQPGHGARGRRGRHCPGNVRSRRVRLRRKPPAGDRAKHPDQREPCGCAQPRGLCTDHGSRSLQQQPAGS